MDEGDVAGNTDVIVVGAGLAGLTAATELARRGHDVVVLEKSKQLGGRAATRIENGYAWNLGPHALYRHGRAKRILEELGVVVRGGVPSGSGQYAVDGYRAHALPSGFVSLLSTGLLPLGAKLELARLLVGIPRIDASALMGVTLETWLHERVRHDAVRRFLRALVRLTTYCNAPDLLSAGEAVEQLQLAVAGNVLYLNGGWQTLIDGLRDAARNAGARIESSASVRAIEHAGRVAGVRLADGRRIAADAVVAAVPPQVVAGLFDDGMTLRLRTALDGLVPVRAACLDLALSRLPVPKATFALGIDRALYLSVHSAVAELAPAGAAVVHVAKYLAPDDRDGAAAEPELEALMDLAQPGWRAHVLERRFLPAMVVTHALPTAAMGGKTGRPDVTLDGVNGAWIAGDWVGDEGLLADAAVASGRTAAERCHAYLAARQAKAA